MCFSVNIQEKVSKIKKNGKLRNFYNAEEVL